jgi:hypothetical protein
MNAGQAFVYTQTLFHSSPPNFSSSPRVAAGAMAIPREANLLFVSLTQRSQGDLFTIYKTPDDFYIDHIYGTAPRNAIELGAVRAECEPVSVERLRAVAGEANGGVHG